jgi:hypothetical protein
MVSKPIKQPSSWVGTVFTPVADEDAKSDAAITVTETPHRRRGLPVKYSPL